MGRFPRIDLKRVRTVSLKGRKSKVRMGDFAQTLPPKVTLSQFLSSLPNILAGKDFREVVAKMATAHRRGRPIIFALGAHVIKVGLSPVIIQLIDRGLISLIALNGAGVIHDAEIALVGKTSEDVEEGLREGRFGMAEETARFLNTAINDGVSSGMGLGEAVGNALVKFDPPYANLSLMAAATKKGIPVTVHVALGTDIIHIHPSINGAMTGEGSLRDFQTFASAVARLDGGVYLNVGSAVILPEVFLKALTLVRNLGFKVRRFTTVNMDFMRHYRPEMNVVRRPTSQGGRGYTLVGHHEIMLPLLAAALLESISVT